MFDAKHGDGPIFVVDFVDDSICAAPGRPESGEFALQLMSNLARVVG
jgi:hypothetical protein